MVFKRYPSPFLFLDNALETKTLLEVVEFLEKQTQEEKWWELYLATLPMNEKSYDTWKKDVQGPQRVNLPSKIDTEKTIKKSQDILSGFKPPQ